MRFNECEELLRIITSFDRRPFPEGAAATWYEILRETTYEDAKAAVVEYFAAGTDSVPTLLPGRVRSGAARYRDLRAASARPAIQAAPPKPAAMTRSAAFLAARDQIRQATTRGSAKIRERDPDLPAYKHRTGTFAKIA